MNILTSVWLHPKQTVRYMIDNNLLKIAILLVAIGSFLSVFMPPIENAVPADPSYAELGLEPTIYSFGGLIISGIVAAIFMFIIMFVITGVVFLVGKLFKGQGTYWDVFQAMSLTMIPTILIGVFGFVWAAFDINSFNEVNPTGVMTLLYLALSTIVGIWSIVISIGALAEANRYSNWRAFFTLILPAFIFFILLIALVLLVVSMFFMI